MEIRFHRDPETGQPHIYDHGVTEGEVREVMRGSGEYRRGTGSSWVALGQTTAGRYLRVIYVPDSGADSIFVVTAFDLTGKPLKAYRRRQRRKTR